MLVPPENYIFPTTIYLIKFYVLLIFSLVFMSLYPNYHKMFCILPLAFIDHHLLNIFDFSFTSSSNSLKLHVFCLYIQFRFEERKPYVFTLLFDLLWMVMAMVMLMMLNVVLTFMLMWLIKIMLIIHHSIETAMMFFFNIDLPAFSYLRMKVTSSGQRYSVAELQTC